MLARLLPRQWSEPGQFRLLIRDRDVKVHRGVRRASTTIAGIPGRPLAEAVGHDRRLVTLRLVYLILRRSVTGRG
jgi:hypothetical protein